MTKLTTRFSLLFSLLPALAFLLITVIPATAKTPPKKGLWARVTLLAPRPIEWRTHIIAHLPGKQNELFASSSVAVTGENIPFISSENSSTWIDLSQVVPNGVASVRFLFETRPELGTRGVRARFDIASAPEGDQYIIRSIEEHDTGNVISLRIPADGDKKWLLSIREDTQRRLNEVKELNLKAGPLPKKIWAMTGFRSNGQFYTDPAIARMDFDIIKLLGMNSFWEQNGGQPGVLREMAHARGIDRSTVYWRSVAFLPRGADNVVHMDWQELAKVINNVYRESMNNTRKAHPAGTDPGMPTVVADLMDEPACQDFGGAEMQTAFRSFLQSQNFSPEYFGKKTWDEISSPQFGWWQFFKLRAGMDMTDLNNRRLFYWANRFWNISTARTYAMANQRVQEYSRAAGINVIGTRVNFGPPWLYDYGTAPRGIDAFEFGRQHSVSLGFNEDWVGNGSRRIPLESNTLLMDWSRDAARPRTPLIGSYITRDANRNTVKLRTFGCLAREAKIFDFYYYGPAYTFFDHWSDNISMVQGVGELTRDIGQVDDLLWDGHAPKAEVALLYSKSWPVWKEDDSEQAEQMMVYMALLHAGVPVDLVSDEQIADGSFAAKRYKSLYVVNESIPARAASAIEKWVQSGGHLWTEGWAGMKDEYNTPTSAWNALLGVTRRSWKPTGDLARIGEQIRPDDWQRASFSRETTLEKSGAPSEYSTPAELPTSGAYRRRHGLGIVQVVPTSVGREYMDAATESERSLGHAVVYPNDLKRSIITGFALESKVQVPAKTSANGILAWPLWTKQKGVVLLANFTGEPNGRVTVQFTTPKKLKKLRSLRYGALKFTRSANNGISATLPMADVTDILVVE